MKMSTIMWVFEGVWVICAKFPFPHSLDVPIKTFANSLDVLNERTHIHCFQTQLTESFYFSIVGSARGTLSVHACTNNYFRCTICEVHDHVRKYVIRCTKKRIPRFLILEVLYFQVHPFTLYRKQADIFKTFV